MRFFFLVGGVAVATSGWSYDFSTALQFNAFIFGSASISANETEGAVAVGGALTTSNATNFQAVGYNATIGSTTKIGLYVGGNASVGGGQLNNGYNGYVGGSFVSPSGPFNLNGGGKLYVAGTVGLNAVQNPGTSLVKGGTPIDETAFTAVQKAALQEATYLSGLKPSYMLSTTDFYDKNHQLQSPTIDVSALASLAGNKTVKVLNVDLALLNSFPNQMLNFSDYGSNTLIVNVTNSGGLSDDWKTTLGQHNAGQTLFNFETATKLTVESGSYLYGSVLAPSAFVDQKQVIDGSLVAASWQDLSNELHFDGHFVGSVPTGTVPEPTTIALAISGAAAFVRRRLKKS